MIDTNTQECRLFHHHPASSKALALIILPVVAGHDVGAAIQLTSIQYTYAGSTLWTCGATTTLRRWS